MQFRKDDRIEPTEENDHYTTGTVMEDMDEVDFSSRPNAVYVLLDDEIFPRFVDAMRFRKVG